MADRLRDRLPERPPEDGSETLDAFVAWIDERGLSPYAHQEEALLELFAGQHVILNTPTGSGKSLVALGLHCKALAEGRRSFYTAPVKALVSEKFFSLCDDLGPENVGMLTGDASINPDAPVICCTAEVLANMALRQGARLDAPYAVLDEFHFYGDRERGVAWQLPLLCLPDTQFLLMSATLGNTAPIAERLRDRSGRTVAEVFSDERPVPLEFEYLETPLSETVETLLASDRAPIYIVHFTQREAAEQAQGMTGARIAGREERSRLTEALAGTRFDSPYGKDVRRFLRAGVGLHHAGLLPRYRLLVEQLAQQGMLKVICGTDTLGVGVNIPIRTVLFSRFCKFDGEKVSLLTVREFKQIAGRSGRRGFDERGFVICQAPQHVIENKRAAAKGKRPGKRPPARGFVPWNRDTFHGWIERPPEPLQSRFEVSHGMLVSVLQREDADPARGGGYRVLLDLIESSHETPARKRRHRRSAAAHFRALRRAGIISVAAGSAEVRVDGDLQREFSLHHSLSIYLVDAVAALDPDAPEYALKLLSLVEAILASPVVVLRQQERKARGALIARLKAEGVPYEERMTRIAEVTHPRPEAEFLDATFRIFAESHPWVRSEHIRPKSIAREMFEECLSFEGYVRRYELARSEGVLLRYLSQVYGTLQRGIPDFAKNEEIDEAAAFLRDLVVRVDESLLEAWEQLGLEAPEADADRPPSGPALPDPRALAARVRSQLHALVAALARREYAEALSLLRDAGEHGWDADSLQAALAPFYAEHERILFDPPARGGRFTRSERTDPSSGTFNQTLCDPAGDHMWFLAGRYQVDPEHPLEGPLLILERIGC